MKKLTFPLLVMMLEHRDLERRRRKRRAAYARRKLSQKGQS